MMIENLHFKFPFGLIGQDLILKKNVQFELDNNGRIVNLSYQNFNKKEFIDHKLEGNDIIIPGLINSHTHIADSFAKEKGYNKGLIQVVAPPNGIKHKLLEKTQNNIKKKSIQSAAFEMLGNGITFFADFRERGVEGIKLLKDSLTSIPIKYKIFGRFQKKEEIKTIFQNADGIGLSSYSKASETIKKDLRIYKGKYNKQIACHHAEYRRKPDLFNTLIDDKLIDLIVHGTQLLEKDLILLKRSNLSLVLCPRCNGYFGVGIPPIEKILKQKIPISLGTDNLMVNSADLFEEMRFLFLIFKLNNFDKEISLNAKELLKMCTINASKALDLDRDIGCIEDGKSADFNVIDLSDPNLYIPYIDKKAIYSLLVQRVNSKNIKKVYINGKKTYERK
ncbi:MAG: amidohydrolase family protein [Candidatus Lokiarchaeota archaeon]|nr:amidohydrolase family protein [Candidatus Lokiarchaeota archaeon]MBD3198731.1 amidohydrolase family protein [Candidatus Lokiarchaeota archaeon]